MTPSTFEPIKIETFVCKWTIAVEQHDGSIKDSSGEVGIFDGSAWSGVSAESLTAEELRAISSALLSLAEYLEANPVDPQWIARQNADAAWLALPLKARQQALDEQQQLRTKNQSFDVRERARELAALGQSSDS